MDESRTRWVFVGLALVMLGLSRSQRAKENVEDDGTTADLIGAFGGTCLVVALGLWIWPYVRS